MKKLFICILVLLSGGPAWAQVPFNRATSGGPEPDNCVWGRVEYLGWWIKGAPLPIPLVSTSAPGVNGLVPTGTLYGQDKQGFGYFNGVRPVLGFWVDPEGALGFEASGFAMEQKNAGFNLSSNTNPSFGIPFLSPIDNSAQIVSTTFPGGGAGAVIINNSLRFWGYNGDALVTVIRSAGLEVNLIGGFRYLDLLEDFQLNNLEANGATTDGFQTRNQIYAPEVGTRVRLAGDVFFMDMTGKVGFGANHQIENIFGQTTFTNPTIGTAVTPGGIFAQPSNMGNHERTAFSVLSEAQVRMGLEFSSHIRFSVGYDFLYISDMVRPGSQLDPAINFGQGLGGAARPAFGFNSTNFFAHGIDVGLELRF